MCKIKYFFFKETLSTIIFRDQYDLNYLLIYFSSNCMHMNNTKNNLTPEIKKELKKSKLDILTNENDFLVKNLKKAG